VLTRISEGVLVHQSAFCQSNAVVVQGRDGVLLVDPGVHGHELAALADDLHTLGQEVAVGFSTHPHWDHMLWHARLGTAPRLATAQCAATAHDRLVDAQTKAARIAEDVSLDLLGELTPLPAGASEIPWNGPRVRILEHRAHAPGHAALLMEDDGILMSGDMLSDVEVPLLDLDDRGDPMSHYLDALRMFDDVTAGANIVVPGHGSLGRGEEVGSRVDRDRRYILALRGGDDPEDSRIGPSATYGRDWLPGEHDRQVAYATQRRRAGLS
jgi:glyoxylase-like metal-dependent hydrolase (beta-lactamase superfamily II)